MTDDGGGPAARGEIRLHVEGNVGELDVAVLQRAVNSFAELLRSTLPVRWVLSDLSLSSITTAARPADDQLTGIDVDAEFERIARGFDVLSRTAEAPDRWTDGMLQGVGALGDVLDLPGVQGITLTLGGERSVPLTRDTGRNARAALEGGPESLGAVTGKVDRFFLRDNHHEFGLVDDDTGDKVTVTFPRGRADDILPAIGKRVTVWGLLRRTPDGRKRAIRMDEFHLAPALPTPRLSDVVGSLGSDWTGGASSVDWVRGQRGED